MVLLGQILLVGGVVGFVVIGVAMARTAMELRETPEALGKRLAILAVVEAPFLLAFLAGCLILFT